MEASHRSMRLREWLVAQIDSGRYAGLSWESADKSMFRIPWKHAAKQDYRQNEDAALFKAWAEYKGKHQEGRDKADPSTWKTRLRCALNKSTDFQEVHERSQLDISEPYKVYRILVDSDRPTESPVILTSRNTGGLRNPPPLAGVQSERDRKLLVNEWLCLCPEGDATGSSPSTAVPVSLPMPQITDFRLEVCVFYRGCLVREVLSNSPDGCFILHGPVPLGNERIYGLCTAHVALFPRPDLLAMPPGIAQAMSHLLPHLERGVLVWVAPDGVFIKRFCQGRVYWDGPLAHCSTQPNKLDRERTCKLLDMQIFIKELQNFIQGLGPAPRYEIDLCFGEVFPDANEPKSKKLITARVVPLFAKGMVERLQRPGQEDASLSPHT